MGLQKKAVHAFFHLCFGDNVMTNFVAYNKLQIKCYHLRNVAYTTCNLSDGGILCRQLLDHFSRISDYASERDDTLQRR